MKLMNLAAALALAATLATAGGVASAQPWRSDGDRDWPMHGWGHWGMGSGMMGGPGMMGPGMMPMMFVMMDTDGDRAISFEEMKAVHKRMFDLVDEDKDGMVTIDEMHAFWGVRRDRE